MKKLLIVVDMQKDFIDGALGTAEAQRILPAVKERIAGFRAEGGEVVFTRDTHGADYLSTKEGRHLPVPHCIEGTPGWQIAEGLRKEGEQVFDKPSFGSLALAEYVRAGGYGSVEFIGVCTDICVISNALLVGAYCPETEICVRADCCAGTTPEAHAAALCSMRSCQAEIV
ncbi:MAG TPA: cysteine hydrolase [Candidatus Scatosoma pullicola]|nr:cysteine hydrolase [Candidatus Scatosoma pullicola]